MSKTMSTTGHLEAQDTVIILINQLLFFIDVLRRPQVGLRNTWRPWNLKNLEGYRTKAKWRLRDFVPAS